MNDRPPFVSDHDLLTFLAAFRGIDLNSARRRIAEIAAARVEPDGDPVVIDGFSFSIRGGAVLLKPVEVAKSRRRKVKA